jgi:amino acid adenylation domain-containing protein
MAQHFQVLLDGMVHAPDTPVDELPLLAEAERGLLLNGWSRGPTIEPAAQCLHQLIEAQAARTPQAEAVILGQERMTYAELDRRANQLAHRLRRLGAGPERLVGICVERSLEMVVGLLGILKSGAGYVFIEPSTPPERREFILRDSGARLIVARERTMAALPSTVEACVCVDRNWQAVAREPTRKPEETARGDNLAYCIYTSGSTGTPKAVGIRHAGCVSFLHWAATVFSQADVAGVLTSSSPMFDCALFELFMPLARGGTAILTDSLLSLPELRTATPITLLMAAPTVIAELLQSGGLPASVRAVNLSGEAVPRFLPERLYRSTAVERVYNFYGISEITTHATGTLLQPDADGDAEGSHLADPVIGRPIAGVSAYILDTSMNPVPIGVTGELHIGGAGVARGYLGRPALTAERFLPDPYSGAPGSRLYRSGDLARWRADGQIEFLGRGDHQVKLRGFRVELGEVESALARCPDVHDAAVLLREDPSGRKRLVAYAVPVEGAKPGAAELRAFLREQLPEHEVPTAFVMLRSMPLLRNGKVDRAALPPPEPELRETDDGVWRMADAIETQVELIWNELLGRHETVAWDSFFDLGGDSLLALVMLTRVQETFSVRVPVGRFMAAPTIEELSTAIRGHGWGMAPSCLVKVSGAGEQRPFFCVHPGGGELYELRYLNRELGERPIYALMPIGWNGEAEPLASIEEMATEYIQKIREIQPHGPYLLGGYSLGGVIALEIAQQLLTIGERTSFLGLFETWPVVDVVCLPEDAYEYESTAAAVELAKQTGRVALPAEELLYLKSMSHAIPGLEQLERDLRDKKIYDFDGLCRELEDMRPKLQLALEQLKQRGLVVNEMDIGEFYRMHEVAAKQIWALSMYRPTPYPGAATLFAGRTTEGTRVLERVWSALVESLRVEHTTSEEHSIFFRDPLVARALQRCLEDADALSSASGPEAVGSR